MATVATVLEKAHLEDYLKSASTNRPLSISASTATPVLDLELESHSSSAIATKPWTYSSAIGPHTEVGNYLPWLLNVLNYFMKI